MRPHIPWEGSLLDPVGPSSKAGEGWEPPDGGFSF